MIEFTIDCPMFLRLTSLLLGKSGQYLVSVGGVRAATPEDELDYEAMDARTSIVSLEFIRGARLSFPTSSIQLIEWLLKNDDMYFMFPPWFEPVVAARNVDAAGEILHWAAAPLDDEIREKGDELDTVAEKVARYQVEQELADLRGEREAIDSIGTSISSGSDLTVEDLEAVIHEEAPAELEVKLDAGSERPAAAEARNVELKIQRSERSNPSISRPFTTKERNNIENLIRSLKCVLGFQDFADNWKSATREEMYTEFRRLAELASLPLERRGPGVKRMRQHIDKAVKESRITKDTPQNQAIRRIFNNILDAPER